MASDAMSSTNPALEALGDNAPYARTNHVRGVAAGVFAETAREFIHPEIILTGLIWALTESPVLTALVPVINKVGVMGPQLLFGARVEHLPRRRPVFVIVTVVRGVAMAGLVGSIGWLTLHGPTAGALALFYTMYLGGCVATACGHVVFMDMIGRLIPENRVASFIGLRMVLGGALAMAVAFLVIQPTLTALSTPLNYLLLAAVGAVLVVVDMSIWCTARECPGPAARRRPSLGESLRRGFGWLRDDARYRKFLWTRIGFRVSYLGLAFFIPFGEQELAREGAAGMAMLGGILVGTQRLSSVLASALWGRVADRLGSRFTLICAGALLVIAPLGAIAATVAPGLYDVDLPAVDRGLDLPMTVYLLALVTLTFGIRAQILGGQRLLITNAPPDRRPTYLSFINTLTSPLTLLPLAGAGLARLTGMTAVFFAVVGGGLIILLAALTMSPDRPTPMGPSPDPSAAEA